MNIPACRLEGLLDYLHEVPDPRMKLGIRHRMSSVLAVSMCAVMGGARSFYAMVDWAKSCTQKTLSRLGCRFKDGRYIPPSEPTIRRMLRDIDADALDQGRNAWLLAQFPIQDGQAIAVDGKTQRRARNKTGHQVHPISAILHREKVVVAQEVTREKSNEIPVLRSMLAEMDIQGAVVTADAMHTQKDMAQFIKGHKHAEYLFTVKDNQPTLRADIEALGLDSFPPVYETNDGGYGRIEIRRIWCSSELQGYIDVPFHKQVGRIERITEEVNKGSVRQEVVYLITSLDEKSAFPKDFWN